MLWPCESTDTTKIDKRIGAFAQVSTLTIISGDGNVILCPKTVITQRGSSVSQSVAIVTVNS